MIFLVVISLDYDDNNHTGFINIMDDDICSISVLDEYGTDDGLVYFSINTISKLVFDGMYEKQTKKYLNSL